MARTTSARAKPTITVAQWSDDVAAEVVLIFGKSRMLRDRARARLRARLRAETADIEISELDASSYEPGTLSALASPSLFFEPRLVLIDKVEGANEAFVAESLDVLDQHPEGVTLVFEHAGGVRGKKVLDAIRGLGSRAVEIEAPEYKRDADWDAYVRAEFQLASKKVEAVAVRDLVAMFKDRGEELAGAVQQLIQMTPGTVDAGVVREVFGQHVETTAFRVSDAAFGGNLGDSLVSVRHALDSGADPVPIVAAFASKARLMAKVAGRSGADAQIAREIGAADWQVQRARRDLRGWSDRSLGRIIVAIAQADADIKGGARTPLFSLEQLVTIVATRGSAYRFG